MKYITLISVLFFVTSCGNPHVSSVRKNVDRVVSPLTEEECDEALSLARVHTEQEQYEAVAQCQEQEQHQEQEQFVEESAAAKTWRFAELVANFKAEVHADQPALVEAYDCNGSLMIEEEVSDSSFIGVTAPGSSICSVSLSNL